jgi:hypothetical protein
MKKIPLTSDSLKLMEIQSDEVFINTSSDGVNLVGEAYFDGYDGIILHAKNLAPSFFDLSTGFAGDILQKFATYKIRLAIVGDFSDVASQSLRAFIRESNQYGHITFAATTSEALEKIQAY